MGQIGQPSLEFILAPLSHDKYISIGGSAALRSSVGVVWDHETYRPLDRNETWPLLTTGGSISMQDVTLTVTGFQHPYVFTLTATDLPQNNSLVLGLDPHPGDANMDGSVNVGDLGIMAGNWGRTGMLWGEGDFTGEGDVNVGDLGVLSGAWGWTADPGMLSQGQDEPILQDFDGNGEIDDEDAKEVFRRMLLWKVD